MKKLVFILTVVLALIMGSDFVCAQTKYYLNAASNGTTKNTCNGIFYDNGGPAAGASGNYLNNVDWSITFCPDAPSKRSVMKFESFDLDPSDSVIIYYGTDTNEVMRYSDNSTQQTSFSNADLVDAIIIPPITDASGCLTFRLISDAGHVKSGWKANVVCQVVCQDVKVELDTVFTKIDSLGNASIRPRTDTNEVVIVQVDSNYPGQIDSIYTDEEGQTFYYIHKVVGFSAIDICSKDSVELTAKVTFPYNDVAYHQSTDNCIYYWSYGDGTNDTIYGDSVAHHKWDKNRGHDLRLWVQDTTAGGCSSDLYTSRIRIAKNPIKTVRPFQDMCSGTNQQVSVGVSGNSNISLDTISFSQKEKQEFDTRTFIPDGSGYQCYESPIEFTTFSPGDVVSSGSDIESICIAMEHSYIGDLGISLICPTGQTLTLKYNTHATCGNLGIPNEQDSYPQNDSNVNHIGICWEYCWSNQYSTNNPQGVFSGSGQNNMFQGVNTTGANCQACFTLDSTHIGDTAYYFQTPIQNLAIGSDGTVLDKVSAQTVDLNGFDVFIGCPLNGTWTIRVCDNWGSDNGWICKWNMSVGKEGTEWIYQVPIDTVIWGGPFLTHSSATSGVLAPPVDSCGNYHYDIELIDEFGCSWKTENTLPVVCTPIVDLGPDITTCESKIVNLDAGNPTAEDWVWEPTGEHSQTISVDPGDNVTGPMRYSVQVTNYNGKLHCYGIDTIVVNINGAAKASFTADKYPLEGCEPYSFQLMSTSTNIAKYEWTIGETTDTTANPKRTLQYGSYPVSLKVTTNEGCVDSIKYDNMVNVFRSPVADFGWNPTIIASTNPTVTMVNKSSPDDPTNLYRWEFQTNRNNTADIVNIFDKNPTYTWQKRPGESLAGDYNVTLDAFSHNDAPSGYVYECHDTITKNITIINDNIIFPTVLTPNGDGVNDVFEIINLVKGQAFPDNELTVFNRYGKRIFFVQDIRNASQFWDPDKTNSPSGTYFYHFVGKGPIRSVDFNGSVEVMRE